MECSELDLCTTWVMWAYPTSSGHHCGQLMETIATTHTIIMVAIAVKVVFPMTQQFPANNFGIVSLPPHVATQGVAGWLMHKDTLRPTVNSSGVSSCVLCTITHVHLPSHTSYCSCSMLICSLFISSSTLNVLFWSASLVCCACLPSSCWSK